ncbi:MAG: hypothetical protein JWO57_447 [Pseudonocardiales bacterium]|nr:hypothetical protein [Pseudonocardiales bacterium]
MGARISGCLDLSYVDFDHPIELVDCLFDSSIDLSYAKLRTIDLTRSLFTATESPVIRAEQLQTSGGLTLAGMIAAADGDDGVVVLRGAHIGGQLDLRSATLSNGTGPVLAADGFQVDSDVSLADLHARGAHTADEHSRDRGVIRLPGATIAGQLVLANAKLTNAQGRGLLADEISVAQDLSLEALQCEANSRFAAVSLAAAKIGGQLDLHEARLVNGGATHVALSLASASAGELHLDAESFAHSAGGGPQMLIDGATYVGLPCDGPNDVVTTWCDLLRWATPTYTTQPYQQLASALTAAGRLQDAGRALMAAQDARLARLLQPQRSDRRARRNRLALLRLGMHLQRIVIGYGYRTRRAFWVVAAAAVLAAALGGLAAHTKAGESYAANRPGSNGKPAQSCSSVEQISLGLTLGIPFISNATAGDCHYDTTTLRGSEFAIANAVLQAIAGAAAVLAVAGYTGLVRQS